MNTFTLYTAHLAGDAKNTHYPNKQDITIAADLEVAVKYDHVAAAYAGQVRSNFGFTASDCLVMDIDNDHTEDPTQWVTPDALALELPGVGFMTATSRNHNRPKGVKVARPRFHVYFPIHQVTDAAAYAGLKKSLADRFSFFDQAALDAARFLYGHPAPECQAFDGKDTVDEWLASRAEEDAFVAFDAATMAIGEGSRNNTLSLFAGRVLIRYGNTDQARALFDRKAVLCDPPLPEGEVEAIWRSATRFATKVAQDPSYIAPEVYAALTSLCPDDFTDIGQASVMALHYLDRVRYSAATKWLAYSGGVWLENEQIAHGFFQELTERQLTQSRERITMATAIASDTGVLEALATKKCASALASFSGNQAEAFEQLEGAERFHKYVLGRRSARSIRDTMKETQPLVLVDPAELDTDPYALCTPQGTFDLRYGTTRVRENRSGDLITKQTSLAPGEQGRVMWEETLARIFQDDADLVRYVQRICGLAAIGKVMVEALIIAYGDGSNGKSTFWNTIARVLGSYADSISAEVLIAGKKNSAKNDMAETRGKRLLIAAETEEGKRLSTSSAKQLASTDKIAAEKKYKDPFSFTPTHSLVLYTNHLPKVGAMDAGIWRRLIVIPFEAKIQGASDVKNYADVLYEQAGPAVLAWVMEGARLIHEEGYRLSPPARVRQATDAYREANNWFAHFVDETCTTGDGLTARSGELYQAYRAWALGNGEYVRSTRDFYSALAHNGLNRYRTNKGWIVGGLALKSEEEWFGEPF